MLAVSLPVEARQKFISTEFRIWILEAETNDTAWFHYFLGLGLR